MTPPRLNLLVIQSEEHSNTVRFYELLGLHFQEEQHGKGPVHWAATSGGLVMEIYPARSSDEVDGDRHANRTHFGAERSSRKSDPPQKTVESACFSGRFDVKDVDGGRIRSDTSGSPGRDEHSRDREGVSRSPVHWELRAGNHVRTRELVTRECAS